MSYASIYVQMAVYKVKTQTYKQTVSSRIKCKRERYLRLMTFLEFIQVMGKLALSTEWVDGYFITKIVKQFVIKFEQSLSQIEIIIPTNKFVCDTGVYTFVCTARLTQ
jgi:hypothetical protein